MSKELKSNSDNKIANKYYCRLCAKEQGTIYIFQNDQEYAQQIQQSIQIELHIDDGLPSWLCVPCSELLPTFYNFRKQCHAAQKQLQEIFKIFCDFKVEVNSDTDNFDNDCIEENDEIEDTWSELKKSNEETLENEKKKENGKSKKQIRNVSDDLCEVKLEDCQQSLNATEGYECMREQKSGWSSVLNNEFNEDIIEIKNENILEENDVSNAGVENVENDTNKSSDEGKIKLKKNKRIVDKEVQLLIDNHFKTEYRKKLKVYCCNLCHKYVRTRTLVKVHFNTKCKKTDYAVKKKKILPVGSDVEEEECIKKYDGILKAEYTIYKCKYCSKIFQSKIRLRTHKNKYCQKKEPNSLRNYMCEHCGKAFKLRCVLLQHMRAHSSKKFSCNLCDKRFTRSSHVIIHMRIHNNYKPYVCETCGRSFTKSSDLLRHKIIHSDVRKHSCPLCPRTFKRSGDVTSHLRVHTGDKPYKCEPCAKFYTNFSSLRKHLKKNCTFKKGTSNDDANKTDETTNPVTRCT